MSGHPIPTIFDQSKTFFAEPLDFQMVETYSLIMTTRTNTPEASPKTELEKIREAKALLEKMDRYLKSRKAKTGLDYTSFTLRPFDR